MEGKRPRIRSAAARMILMLVVAHACCAAEYEVGGPLEGLKLPANAALKKVSYPGSVETWAGARGFFDAQSLLKNWVAPALPASAALKVETCAGVEVVRCNAGSPVFKLDLGERDIGLYAVRVIGAVEKAKVRPFLEPLYVTMRVNDGLKGEIQSYRMRVGYSEEFRSVVEIYFHAVEKRSYQVELSVDKGSTVDLLVHNIMLDDALAGTTRRAAKKRMTLMTPAEVAVIRQELPADRKQRLEAAARHYSPAERLARDEAIWKWQPPVNSQGTLREKIYYTKGETPGAADKTAAEIAAQYGEWKDAEAIGGGNLPGPPAQRLQVANPFLENKKLGLQYTMDDYLARKPLPGLYPFKDDGAGFYFPDPKDPDAGRYLCPIGEGICHRLSASARMGDKMAETWLQTGNRDSARDAAVALIAYAYNFPAYDGENSLVTAMTGHTPWMRAGSRRWMGAPLWMLNPECYDKLFDYIKGNEELAQSIARFVPWVKSSDDVIQLLDVYLVQTTAKHILRKHYGLDNAPAQIAEIAAVLGDPTITDPWMDWLFAKTSIYAVGTGGIQDLMVLGNGREGTGNIGSTFYSQEEGARPVGVELQRYLEADGNPKYNLSDRALYPKPLAHCYWHLGIVIGGLDFARIGDVTGPDKSPGMTMGREFDSACRYGWKWSADPRFAWALKYVCGRRAETDAEWAPIEKAAAEVKRAPWLDNRSRALENWFGVLETGIEHDDYRFRRAAYLRTGIGHGHEHGDTLDLQFVAHGLPMTVDAGCRPGYDKPNCRTTRIHNVVEVDGLQGGNANYGLCSYAWTSALSDAPGARYLQAIAVPPPHATLFRRQIALVDVDEGQGSEPLPAALQKPGSKLKAGVVTANSYILDIFRVSGGKTHTYCFHGPVQDDFQWNATDAQPVADKTLREVAESGDDATAKAAAAGKKFSANTVDDTKDDAAYLALFNLSKDAKEAGRCPDQFQAAWRSTRDGKDGSEQQMLGVNFDETAPRKVTRLTLLDASGMRALRANVATTAESSAHFTYTQVMLQKHAAADKLDSAFAAVIEPCAGESFLASIRTLPIQGNDADARKAVAVEVKTKNGRTDSCFADGYPEKTRTFQAGGDAFRMSGEFGFYSADAQGLRLATLAGGTALEGPGLKLQLARREHIGKVIRVDYLAKTLWIDAPWPAACAGGLFEIGSPERMTSYMSALIVPDNKGSAITATRGADAYRSSVEGVNPRDGSLKCALHVPTAWNQAKGLVASNDTMTRFWRVDHQVAGEFKVAAGGAVSAADFAPSGALRLWEYGVGDTVRQSAFISVHRLEPGVYEVTGNVDAEVTLPSGKTQKVSAEQFSKGPVRFN